jgi:hypothetical protein
MRTLLLERHEASIGLRDQLKLQSTKPLEPEIAEELRTLGYLH